MVMEPTANVSPAEVDTSWPFHSVWEAVEVFGEWYTGSGSTSHCESNVKLGAVPLVASSVMLDCLKKLE
jgi:hypothetical protein